MKLNSIVTESNINHNYTYSATLNRPIALNHSLKANCTLNLTHHTNSIDDFKGSHIVNKSCQKPNEVCYTPTTEYSTYRNINKNDIELDKTRRSRQHDQNEKRSLYSHKDQAKRDLSMPPINCREQQQVDEIFCSKYSFGLSKYSIGDLDQPSNIINLSNSNVYDSVVDNDSVTPPPVRIVHEYANRKAIIRPLAFRPVQTERDHTGHGHISPVTPSAAPSNTTTLSRRYSPPPIPPHASRIPRKSNLSRVQSLRSGDSSGYHSSGRNAGTTNGTTSSTDTSSPTFEETASLMDSTITGEIYANTAELIGEYQHDDHEDFLAKTSLESEISTKRDHTRMLATALSKSNAKLLTAEIHIKELKTRLLQKTAEANTTKENLALVRRSLENQTQKSQSLEKSMQSLQALKFDRTKERVSKDKTTQANISECDLELDRLLEQFDDERRTWLDEKLKVLTYQRHVESNYQTLQTKCRHLDSQILHLKSQIKEYRSQHSQSSNHTDSHEKSSPNSIESSSRNFLANINRIEVTEHQASF